MISKFASVEEWRAEAVRLFGEDWMKWAFVCPNCHTVSTAQDFKDAGAPSSAVGQECIGRYKSGIGCDLAAYGLIDMCDVHIGKKPVFAFQEASP